MSCNLQRKGINYVYFCLKSIFGMCDYTSHNLFGNFENTLFQRPVKIVASPRSKSDRNSEMTSLAFWLRNMFNDAPNTLFPLNKLSKWIRIWPTKNVTFISSIWMTSCENLKKTQSIFVQTIWIYGIISVFMTKYKPLAFCGCLFLCTPNSSRLSLS